MAENKYTCGNCGQDFLAEIDGNGAVTCPHCQSVFVVAQQENIETPVPEDPMETAATMQISLKELEEQTAPSPIPNPSVLPDEPVLPQGTEIGGFEIMRLIGRGGMGCVYLALQKSMQRTVALKVLNPSVTKDAEAVQQFLQEVRNSGKLQHPNIVNAFDAGELNGTYYLAMQYVPGDTLDVMLSHNGAFNEMKALSIVMQIADALEYVWTKFKMFHKDIKPSNIMLDEDGSPMLMDMGIAQSLADHKNGPADAPIEGSPYYMSPEQIQGKPLTWTTDLYSLGATLYQLVTGVTPYDSESIEKILEMHCVAPFPSPSVRKPGCNVSKVVVDLIKKMMMKKPGERFASWAAFKKQCKAAHTSLKKANGGIATATISIKTSTLRKKYAGKTLPSKKPASKLPIVIIAIFLLGIVGGLLFLLMKNRESNALAAFENVQTEMNKNPDDVTHIKHLFKETVETANKFGVSGGTKKKINQAYGEYLALEKANSVVNDAFDKLIVETSKFYNNMQQNLTAALRSGKMNVSYIDKELSAIRAQSKKVASAKALTEGRRTQAKNFVNAFTKFEAKLIQFKQRLIQRDKEKQLRIAQEKQAILKRQQAEAARKKRAEEVLSRPRTSESAVSPAASDVNLQALYTEALEAFRSSAARFMLLSDYDGAAAIELPLSVLNAKPKTAAEHKLKRELFSLFQFYKNAAETAQRLWVVMSSDYKKLFGSSEILTLPGGSSQLKLTKITGNRLCLASGNYVCLNELLPRERMRLIAKAIKADGASESDAASFCFFVGLFKDAAKLAPGKARKIEFFAKAYIAAGLKKNNQKLTSRLKREYGKSVYWNENNH